MYSTAPEQLISLTNVSSALGTVKNCNKQWLEMCTCACVCVLSSRDLKCI